MLYNRIIKEKKSVTNLFIYGFGQGFNLIAPLLVAPYLVSVCGEAGFGKIGVGMAFSFFLIVIIDYGSDIIGVKDVAVSREDKNMLEKIISTTYASKLLLLLLILILMPLLYITIPYFYSEKELFFLSLPILIGQFINPTWVFQGIENYKAITFSNIISKLIYVAGVFLTVHEEGDYIYANFWWGAGMIAAYTGAFFYMRTEYVISFTRTSTAEVKDFLKKNFSIFTSQIFVSLQLYSPIMLIRFFAGDAMAGIYRIAEQVFGIFKTYIIIFFNYVYPRVCYLLEKNVKEGMRFWRLYNGANLAFITAAMIILFIAAHPVVLYFNPESIDEITGILRFSLLIPFVMVVSVSLKQLVLGWNFQKIYIRITMVMVAVNLTALVILLPVLEIYGVILSFVLTEAITALLYIITIKNKPGLFKKV